ncbi:unnamed protein product [Closterium sp. NIES-53]
MYALTVSAEGDCYLYVLPDSSIEAAALGASESALPGTAPAEALHTFTLDSGASRCFFRDSTTFTPLPSPVLVRLGDPSGGPVLARSSTVLPCPAVPSGSLSGLHLPSFSTNLVGASAQVSTSGPVAAPCLCRLLSHQTILRHHRLGHPSLPRLRGMHSRLLVSGLPMSLPPLPPSPAPPCPPFVEGRQCAAPHSSFTPTAAPPQTLHMDVWGPAHVIGQSRERYFLLVVDDYTRYTTVPPLRSKGEVHDVFIPWIRAVRLQLHKRFHQDLPVLRLHSDRGGEFSSDLLRDFCRGEGILRSFTLPVSPQQNGVAERRIGLVVEVARTSMIHAATPHFLWPFAVRYTAHQLNLWPRVSLAKTLPTLHWMGKVGDASVFRVWGSRAFFAILPRTSSPPAPFPASSLAFPLTRLAGSFTTPPRTVSCPFTVSSPTALPLSPPLPLFFAPSPPPVDPLTPQGPAPSDVSQVNPLLLAEPVKVTIDSGAARGADYGGAEPTSAEPRGAEPRGTASAEGPAGDSPRLSHRREPLSLQQLREWFAQRTRLRSGAAEAGGLATGGAGAGGARAKDPGAGGPAAGGTRAGGAGATSPGGAGVTAGAGGTGGSGGAGVTAGAGGTGGSGGAGSGGARSRGTGATRAGGDGGTGVGDTGAGGTGVGDPGAGGTGAGGAGAGGAGAGDPSAGGAGAGGPGAGGAGAGGTRAGDPGAGGTGSGGAGAGWSWRP